MVFLSFWYSMRSDLLFTRNVISSFVVILMGCKQRYVSGSSFFFHKLFTDRIEIEAQGTSELNTLENY